jgi:hypothetical protein
VDKFAVFKCGGTAFGMCFDVVEFSLGPQHEKLFETPAKPQDCV